MKDQSIPPTTSTTEAQPNADGTPSPESTESVPKPTVPESYSFKSADGRDFDKSLIDRATPVFKELGLDQAAAQKLVDVWNELSKTEGDRLTKLVNDTRAEWREGINKDPAMSGKLEQIKTDIGRMKDAIFANKPDARKAFEDAMNLTGAGDHPAIVKAWWSASEAYREGQHISGNGPSRHGQAEPGAPERPSAAAAMYPNLPH